MTATVATRSASRRANLRAALIALRVAQDEPELRVLHRLLDTWTGIGLIAIGMQRQGLRLSLTDVAENEWRAMFIWDNPSASPQGLRCRHDTVAGGSGGGVGRREVSAGRRCTSPRR